MKKVLVVDIGGTNVKAMISREGRRKFSSGPDLTPRQLHVMLDGKLDDWKYDVVSDKHGGVTLEPAITKTVAEIHAQHGERQLSAEEFRERFGDTPSDDDVGDYEPE